MPTTPPPVRIGIYGADSVSTHERHGCGLWQAGYGACVEAAEAIPVVLDEKHSGCPLDELLLTVQGVILAGTESGPNPQPAEEEWLCQWCRDHNLPLLAVDRGVQALNTAFNGTLFLDLPREQPEALQHRHPPERGLRHAINVLPKTRLAAIYGEGEVVVNSEHRRAVNRLARGFRVSARALDGIIEAIETEGDGWFAMGVQWQPASGTASGLDIQLFRGLLDACNRRPTKARPTRATAHAA